jgi:transcriptional regulator with XRE-family HTH domain
MKYDSEKLRHQLRVYRKANHLTLADLGEKINKSKTTVWKYENGLLDIDIKTLFEISEALRVSVRFLLESSMDAKSSTLQEDDINAAASSYFMYFYDGYAKKIARCLIVAAGAGERESNLFYHLESFDEPENCRDFYTGQVFTSDPYTNFMFRNANNNVEKIFIVAKEPFKKLGVMKGILTGISYKMFQPISFKVIISERRISEDETLLNWLKISKENLSDLRKYSCLTLSEDYDDFNLKT